jgi:hypothetical protein
VHIYMRIRHPTDISQFETDISQFETDISQFETDISQFSDARDSPCGVRTVHAWCISQGGVRVFNVPGRPCIYMGRPGTLWRVSQGGARRVLGTQ